MRDPVIERKWPISIRNEYSRLGYMAQKHLLSSGESRITLYKDGRRVWYGAIDDGFEMDTLENVVDSAIWLHTVDRLHPGRGEKRDVTMDEIISWL